MIILSAKAYYALRIQYENVYDNWVKKIALILLFCGHIVNAMDIGAGVGGGTSGRSNLALMVGLDGQDTFLSGYVSGVNNSYYYQSDYFLSYGLKVWSGSFFWGDLIGYFGGGVYYTERGLRATTSGDVTEKFNDFAAGPSLRIKWKFLGPIYLAMDAVYGLRNLAANLMLTYQDVEVLSLGYSF